MNKIYASVSVIIPCYRCIKTIRRAVDSVFNQKMIPFEVILIDDFSDDGTLDFLYKMSELYPLNWIKIVQSLENLGPGSARNKGWKVATQDYIAFLDSDDSWHPEKILIQYNYMRENPGLSITGHAYKVIDSDESLPTITLFNFNRFSKIKLLFSNRLSTPTVMIKRELKQRFPEKQKFSEDYSLWLSIMFSGGLCAKSESVLSYLYKPAYGKSGLSSNYFEMQKGEIYNYKLLYEKGCFNIIIFLVVCLYSYLKFFRRLIKSI